MQHLRTLVTLIPLALLSACQSPVEERLDRARQFVFEKKAEEASAEYRSLLTLLEGDERPLAHEARIEALRRIGDLGYLELRDHRGAAEAYRRLIALAPERDEAWESRAKLADLSHRYLRDMEGAMAQWQALATSGRPEAERFHYRLAKAYFEKRDYEQCRSECRALAERAVDEKTAQDALFLLATAYQFEGLYEEGVAAFDEIRKRWPETEIAARAAYHAGLALLAQDEADGAMSAFLDALRRHPDPQRVQAEISRARRKLAELDRIRNQGPRSAFGG